MIFMRSNKRIRLLLIGLILLLWFLATYLLFPSRSSLGLDLIIYQDAKSKSPHIRKFVENLNKLENEESQLFKDNQKLLQDMEQEVDLKLDMLKKEQITKERVHDLAQMQSKFNGVVIPVLVFACNRITVTRCLDQLIKYRPSEEQFPIIVSQDCRDEQTKYAILKYGKQVTLIEQPDESDVHVPPKEKKFSGYYKISRHYGWALNEMFMKYNFKFTIIVEDDLDISPDFYEYFLGTYPLLSKDPSLWCISAWNDNGKADLIDLNNGEHNLYRTDFFPGLGWMLSQELWKELAPKWPKAYWDDWMRRPEIRKDRSCIRPEISRTRTFGKIGVSNGLFYEKHLKYIKLNQKFVPFSRMQLNYLIKNEYDTTFTSQVYQMGSRKVTAQWIIDNPVITFRDQPPNRDDENETAKKIVTVFYNDKMSFVKAARTLGLMDDFKSGVPRTSYRGIISFHKNGYEAFLAPQHGFRGYDTTWS